MMQEKTFEENNSKSHFRGEILNRIYRVWLFRKFLPVFVMELVLISAVLYELGRSVFVERIMTNALQVLFLHPTGVFNFIAVAFIHTPILVKILSLAILLLLALIVRLITQGILRFILVRKGYFSKVGA